MYHDINSLVFTLTYQPKEIYDIGLGEPYLYIKENRVKKYIFNITICLIESNIIPPKNYNGNISVKKIGLSSAYSCNCFDIKKE